MQIMIIFSSWLWLQVGQADVLGDKELRVDHVWGELVLREYAFDDFFTPCLVIADISVLEHDLCVQPYRSGGNDLLDCTREKLL